MICASSWFRELAGRSLNQYPLDLIERNLIVAPVVEAGGPGAFVVRHLLRHFELAAAGFQPRCSLELDDASEIRITKILRMIGECPYGIHDISFSQLDPSSGLPRFNMPFELGIFLGCKAFGSKIQKAKIALVLDKEPYRYQKALSDLSGMDIKYHANDPKQAVGAVRQWIRVVSRRQDIPSPDSIWRLYEHFTRALTETTAGCENLSAQEQPR